MADTILFNANIITFDSRLPRARSVAISHGKIEDLATTGTLKNLKTSKTRLIDCQGKTVMPGFIDGHLHLRAFAESLVTLNLESSRSVSDIQQNVSDLAQTLPPGTWIRGRGYHEFHLAEKRHPTRRDLDPIAPQHPVKLVHRTGHVKVLNSLALKITGISKETPEPDGSLIDREVETGEPNGLIYGMDDLLDKAIPPIDGNLLRHGVTMADSTLSSYGITSIHDASPRNDRGRWEMFRTWKEAGLLKARVTFILGLEGFNEYQNHGFPATTDPDQLRLGGVKMILHEATGRLFPDPVTLNERVLCIHQNRLQTVLHAIEGDAIDAGCAAIKNALDRFPCSDPRHRIEHCSVCPPSLARRLASLGVMVVTHPSFIYFNGDRYLKTVSPEQRRHLYPLGTLMRNGVHIAGSSDSPIAPPNPLMGIYSAISRRTEMGNCILPKEAVSPLEALQMYTTGAARLSFEEKTKGSIFRGKLADFIVLNEDPTVLPVDDIKELEVQMTMINGKIVWKRQ